MKSAALPPVAGYVYVMWTARQPRSADNRIIVKIGDTGNLRSRLQQVRSGLRKWSTADNAPISLIGDHRSWEIFCHWHCDHRGTAWDIAYNALRLADERGIQRLKTDYLLVTDVRSAVGLVEEGRAARISSGLGAVSEVQFC